MKKSMKNLWRIFSGKMESLINHYGLFAVFSFLLMFMPVRRYFDFMAYCTLAILMVGIVGYDPVSLFIPLLFFCGVIFGHLRFQPVNYPLMLKILIIIFLVFALVSSIVGNPVWNWVIRFLSSVIFYYFVYLFIQSEKKMRYTFFAILFGSLVSSVIAALAILGVWTPGPLFFPVFSSFRFAGLYNATILAIFTAFLIIWVFDETLKPRLWPGHTFIKIVILSALTVQLLFTLTRSAWLGLSIGLLVYLGIDFLNNRPRQNFVMFIGITGVVIAAFLLISTSETFEPVRDRIINDTLSGGSVREEERANFYYAKKSLMLAKDHPFGLGIGRAGLLGSEVDGLSLGAHNSYAHVFADMGLITFTAFMIIIIAMFFKILPGALKRYDKYGLSYQNILANIVMLLVAGLYQDLILWLPMWLVPSFLAILVF